MKKFTYGVITTGIILSLAMSPVFADEAQERLMDEPVSSEVELLEEVLKLEEGEGASAVRTISAPAEMEGNIIVEPELRTGEIDIVSVEDEVLIAGDMNEELMYTTSLVAEDSQSAYKKGIPYAIASGILAIGLLLRKKLGLV